MDLDDQLAALAAGDLDGEEARALRARVGDDARLMRRLARLERLEQLLRGWDVDPMTDDQVAALDAEVTAALDALDDGPLATDRAPVLGIGGARPRATERVDDGVGGAATGPAAPRTGDDGDVVDLGAARLRRGIPSWASGLVAAAAALALVTSVGVGLRGLSGDDSDSVASDDAGLAAEADAADAADGSEEEAFAEESRDTAVAADDAAGADEAAPEAAATVGAFPGPEVAADLVLDATTLADLADLLPLQRYVVALRGSDGGVATADGDEDVAARRLDETAEAVLGEPCVADVLAAARPDEVTAFVGTGSYEGVEAVVVVRLREAGDVIERTTAVYDAATCDLVTEVVDER